MIDRLDIHAGMKLKVNPGPHSYSREPYLVEVIAVDRYGFETRIAGPIPAKGIEPHVRRFEFDAPEWRGYHQKRFEKV